eukprot:3039536-Amphidinium_carterae.3
MSAHCWACWEQRECRGCSRRGYLGCEVAPRYCAATECPHIQAGSLARQEHNREHLHCHRDTIIIVNIAP